MVDDGSQNDTPNRATKSRFISLLKGEEGDYFVEVVSAEDARMVGPHWQGLWHMRLANVDRSKEIWLVTTRQAVTGIGLKEFRRPDALMSYIAGLGFDVVPIPISKGRFSKVQ